MEPHEWMWFNERREELWVNILLLVLSYIVTVRHADTFCHNTFKRPSSIVMNIMILTPLFVMKIYSKCPIFNHLKSLAR